MIGALNVSLVVMILTAIVAAANLIIPWVQAGDFSWGSVINLVIAIVLAVISAVTGKAARALKARNLL